MDPDALYGLPLDSFIAERGALAKALRKEGRRDEGAEVAALRKPSVAAWAVNQLVRTQRGAFGELLDAGDALRDAQSDLLAGSGDGRALRAAADRERSAVDGLVETARGLLSAAGAELSPTVLERVADTLHAAALDESAREQVRDGRLVRELRHVGLGLGLGGDVLAAGAPAGGGRRPPDDAAATPRRARAGRAKQGAGAGAEPAVREADPATAPPAAGSAADDRAGADAGPKPSPPKPSAADKRAARERAAAERAEAERQRRERQAARRDARAAHATARRRADAAARELAAARDRRDGAAQALRDAEQTLSAAAQQAEDAAAALTRAEANLAAAEGRD